jgi:hypothetical protein
LLNVDPDVGHQIKGAPLIAVSKEVHHEVAPWVILMHLLALGGMDRKNFPVFWQKHIDEKHPFPEEYEWIESVWSQTITPGQIPAMKTVMDQIAQNTVAYNIEGRGLKWTTPIYPVAGNWRSERTTKKVYVTDVKETLLEVTKGHLAQAEEKIVDLTERLIAATRTFKLREHGLRGQLRQGLEPGSNRVSDTPNKSYRRRHRIVGSV